MTDSLRPEILPPPATHLTRMIVASAAIGMTSAVVAVAIASAPVPAASAPAYTESLHTIAVAVPEAIALPDDAAPLPKSHEVFLVVHEGDTFVKLADLDDGVYPKYGKARVSTVDGSASFVAPVDTKNVPAKWRARLGQTMRVDDNCTAHVTGFAVIARLTGDKNYAGLEGEGAWTAEDILAHGNPILAARLDGCKDGVYARDAALAPIVTFAELTDKDLADEAWGAMIAAPAAHDTQLKWTETGGEGRWYDHTELTTKILRNKATGTTWIVIHDYNNEMSCGGPEANVLAIFRVRQDRTLETVTVTESPIYDVDKVIDVEGDGALELVGHDWLGGDTSIVHAIGGGVLQTDHVQFYGCPC